MLPELTLSLQFSSVAKPDKHRAALARHRVKKWIRHALQTDAEITVRIVLNRGDVNATVWTCDLSHEYVSINADYRS